jgi:hypothetical protein
MEKTSYVIKGFAYPYDLIEPYQDKWSPFLEGYSDVGINMIVDDDNDVVYFGKILASSDQKTTVINPSFDESIYRFGNKFLPFIKPIELFFIVVYA